MISDHWVHQEDVAALVQALNEAGIPATHRTIAKVLGCPLPRANHALFRAKRSGLIEPLGWGLGYVRCPPWD